MLCEDFSGNPSCLSLHCFLTVSVQYIRKGVFVRLTDCMFVWYVCVCVCVCMYRHSISDLLTPLTQLSLGWRNAPLKNTVRFTIGGLFKF